MKNLFTFVLLSTCALFPSPSFAADALDQGTGQDRLFEAIRKGETEEVRKAIASVDLNMERNSKKADVVISGSKPSPAKTNLLPPIPLRFRTEGNWIAFYAQEEIERHTRLPLHAAVWWAKAKGKTDIIEILLDAGADINGRLPSGKESPLHIAVKMGNKALVTLLLDRGADINAADNSGTTALHRASSRSIDCDIFKLLIERGADVNCRDSQGWTTLRGIIEQPYGQQHFDFLLRHGADVQASDHRGVTLLQAAIAGKREQFARQLISAGANVDTVDKDGYTPLLSALVTGQYDFAHSFVERGAIKRIKAIPPAWLQQQKVSAIRFLLRHGIDPNRPDGEGNTSLHLAISKLHGLVGFSIGPKGQSLLVMLLENGADPTIANKAGQRPFDIAVQRKLYEAARILALYMRPAPKVDPLQFYIGSIRKDYLELQRQLADGEDVDAKTDEYGRPLIVKAVMGLDAASVEQLIRSGADVNAPVKGRNPYGGKAHPVSSSEGAALWIAARNGSWLMTKLLLDAGAKSPSHCSKRPIHVAVENGWLELAELLLEYDAPVNAEYASDRRVWTPLHLAIGQGNPALVELLIKHGANVNARGEFDRKPALVCAAKLHRQVITDMLLDQKGIEVNAAGSSGLTALHLAAGQGRLGLISRLLEMGADVNVVEHSSNTPLHWACWGNSLEAVKLLVSRGAEVNYQATVKKPLRGANNQYGSPLHAATRVNWPQSPEIVAFLLEHGARVDARNGLGKTPLHVAIEGVGNITIVRLLIDHGSDVNPFDGRPGFHQMTALQYAASGGHEEVTRILLDQGAEVDRVDYTNSTALYLACCHKRTAIARMLLKKGANPNVNAASGRDTPLHRAVGARDLALVKLLLQYGARVDAKDKDGRTPLDLARKVDEPTMVRILEAQQ